VTGPEPQFDPLTVREAVPGKSRDVVQATRRREAVDNARAIVAFAGGSLSEEMEALHQRFVAGELTGDEVVAQYIRQLDQDESGGRGEV